ncbi:MAG: hypothetical protein D6818_08770 [Bacteroidetes bacterium]|nr:MAG: hypothetical protein D6818_08770 [Bacteroidota bacterium]
MTRLLMAAALCLAGTTLTTAQDYLDEIVQQSCECIDELESSLTAQQMQMRLGLCIFEAAMPYQEQLKADFGIDLGDGANLQKEGERLGQLVGQRMATDCPGTLAKVFESMEQDGAAAANEDEVAAPATTSVFEGTIDEVERDGFVSFTVRNDSGKKLKCYWLTPVEADFDLVDEYTGLAGQSVRITWSELEVFDPRIDEYRKIYVIERIKKLDK